MKSKRLIVCTLIASCIAISGFSFKNNPKSKSIFDIDRRVEMSWRKLEIANKPIKGYLYPAKKGGKWGYINSKGKFLVSPKYDYVTLFSSSGTAVVGNREKGKNYTSAKIINNKEKILLDNIILDNNSYPCGFSYNNSFFDDYFCTFKMKNGNYVIANQDGKIIYTTKNKLGQYSEGFVTEGKSAYINVGKLVNRKTNFKIILNKKYDQICDFSQGHACLFINDLKMDYMDKDGKVHLTPKDYSSWIDSSYNHSCMYDALHYNFYTFYNEAAKDGYKIFYDEKDDKYKLATIKGKVLLSGNNYYNMKYLGEGMFAVDFSEGATQYHSNECKLIFDAKSRKCYKVHYYMLQRYYNGVAAASNLKKSFFIDRKGKIAKGYPMFKKVGQVEKIGGIIMQIIDGKVSYYLKNGAKVYSPDETLITNLTGKMGYKSIRTYRRYDYKLAYPSFFGLPNLAALRNINYSAKKMNKDFFDQIIADKYRGYKDYDVSYSKLNVSLNKNLLLINYSAITKGESSISRPHTFFKYFDIRTGQSYELSSMFKKGIDYNNKLVEKVMELYSHKKLLGLMQYNVDPVMLKNYLMDGNLYITKDGIIITEFRDGSNSYISNEELKVPYSKIKNIIDTNSALWNSFEKTN